LSPSKKITKYLLSHPEINTSIDDEIQRLHKTLNERVTEVYLNLKNDTESHFISTKSWWNEELTSKQKILQTMTTQRTTVIFFQGKPSGQLQKNAKISQLQIITTSISKK